MAKDQPGANDQSKSAHGKEGPHPTDNKRHLEDHDYESDRDALQKARETEAPHFDSDDGANGYGNLHFGDQRGDEERGAAPRHDEGGDFGASGNTAKDSNAPRGGDGREVNLSSTNINESGANAGVRQATGAGYDGAAVSVNADGDAPGVEAYEAAHR